MHIRVISMTLFIPGALTLKDKRQVIQSLTSRIRKLNVSIAEVGHLDHRQLAELGMAIISNRNSYLDGIQQEIFNLIERQYPVEITEMNIENY